MAIPMSSAAVSGCGPGGVVADVLVVGGGLAGCWAALAAARAGASVILAEKGYVGTSGVTASAGPGHWWVPPDPPELREQAIADRCARGMGLADPEWMARVIDLTWRSLPTLSRHYRFSTDESGAVQYRGLRGPEYLRALRAFLIEAGVTIWDHSPTLELLLHADGSVAGARGEHRQRATEWSVRAGAVVLATGGCAFHSHLLGSRTNTGDGYLMAVEAGAELSGMEFSSYYTVAPARTTMTRSMAFAFGRYFDESGRELDIPMGPSATPALARAMGEGRVFCRLDRMPEDIRALMPQISPNFVLPFDRWNIDPYGQRFEVTLRGEGTVRGVGGIRITDDQCQTRVIGLFAAGDAATREFVAGATSGGGAQNSAWALSSGQWAGQGAAIHARIAGARSDLSVSAIGEAGLRDRGTGEARGYADIIGTVQREMEPPHRNLFRTGKMLERSLAALDAEWISVRDRVPGNAGRVKAREAAATLATARWCVRAAIQRTESRGMHQRLDRPGMDGAQAHRLIIGGTDRIDIVPDREVPPMASVG